MKRLLHVILIFFLTFPALQAAGQDSPGAGEPSGAAGSNLVKMNATALLLKNFSFQYERVLSNKFTVAGGFRFMPSGSIPMLDGFESLIDDEETFNHLKGITLSNVGFTAEGRYYVGKKGAPRGFYLAPYVRFASYKASLDEFEYTVELEPPLPSQTRHVPLDGKLSTISGGLLLGAQWRLTEMLYLDWWILGPSIGSASGNLTAEANLSAEEQQALREELEDLEIPMVETTTTVNSSGARMDIDGPWAGLRAGLSLGVRF